MKKDITTETVNKKLIHFNKNDSSKRILSGYRKIYKGTIKNLEKELERKDKLKKTKKVSVNKKPLKKEKSKSKKK